MPHRHLGRTLRLGGAAVALASATACHNNTITTNNYNTYNSTTINVGPMGAHVAGPDNASIDIPANALDTSAAITIAENPKDAPPLPSWWTPAGSIFALMPHGQTFAAPVTIAIPYRSGTNLNLARADPNGTWSLVPGADITNAAAIVSSTHFSFYAVVFAGACGGTVDASVGSDGGLLVQCCETATKLCQKASACSAGDVDDGGAYNLIIFSAVDGGINSYGFTINGDVSQCDSLLGLTCIGQHARSFTASCSPAIGGLQCGTDSRFGNGVVLPNPCGQSL
jgi:hypothetical protein